MEPTRTEKSGTAPVRVVFWAGSFERAGTQQFLLELLRRIDRGRFEPIVFSTKPEGELLPDIESLGVPVHAFGKWRGPLAPTTLRDASRAVRFLRSERIQILSCMLGITTIFGPFVGRMAGVPVVVNNQRNLTYWFSGGVREKVYRYVNRHLVDAVLVNGDTARRELIDRFATPDEKIIEIGAGIDTIRFAGADPDEELSRRLGLSGRRVVGIVGKLSPVKNHRLFLDAAAAIAAVRDDVEFLIVGDGSLRAELEDRAAAPGLEGRVHFVGAREDVPSILKLLDVFVLSSRSEGMPNAVMEAMAAGLPVVATGVGGVPEIVDDGVTGILVADGDVRRLTDSVLGLLSDPARAELMGSAGGELARERYDVRAAVRRVESAFDALLRAAEGRRVEVRSRGGAESAAGGSPEGGGKS